MAMTLAARNAINFLSTRAELTKLVLPFQKQKSRCRMLRHNGLSLLFISRPAAAGTMHVGLQMSMASRTGHNE